MTMNRICFGLGSLLAVPFLASCSDPVPPPAQGAVSIHVSGLNSCSSGNGDWANVPAGQQPVTETDVTTRAIDGADGNVITCKVTPSGDGFAFTAVARSSSASININVPQISNSADGSGTLRIATQYIQPTYSSPSDQPCTFSVQGAKLGVRAGAIWGSVTCPVIEDASGAATLPGGVQGHPQCKIDLPGYYLFENCDQ